MGAYNWNWPILLKEPYFGWIVSGFGHTIMIAVLAWAIAFPLGSLVGMARTTQSPVLRLIGATYVELFRNIPLLVQMFLWYFVFPEVVPKGMGDWLKTEMPYLLQLPFAQFSLLEFVAAVLCLGTYTASRVAEQVRAGIESLPQGQTSAGLAMGFTLPQVYRFVLLPMAYRIIVPPMTSEFLTIFKNSSTALTIGVLELTAQSRQISEYTFRTFEAFTAATLVYIAITLTVIAAMRVLEGRVAVPGYISRAAH